METKNKTDISIVYLNIGSLPLHIDELQSFLFSTNCWPTIIALAETRITETDHSEYHPILPNYTYKGIKSSIRCGSVGVFIKDEIVDSVKIRDDLNIWQGKMWETIWLEIEFNKTTNFIGVVYRHNGKTDIPFFQRSLVKNMKKMTSTRYKSAKFYIVGDFNMDVLRLNEFHNISDFIDMMYSYNAVMLVNKPTRFPIGNQLGSPSIIDHFYTNDPPSVKNFGIITNSISADHYGLLAIIEDSTIRKKEKPRDIFIRDYKNANIGALRESLSLFDPSYLNGMSIEGKFQMFQSHITNCIETHVPLRKLTVREKKFQDKPWITEEFQNNMAYRDKLSRQIRVENNTNLKPLYNKFRKRLEKRLFTAKQNFFKKKIDDSKTNSRHIWNVINEITCRKKTKTQQPKKIRLSNGSLTQNPSEIANTLNNFFVNIGPELAEKLESSNNPYESYMPRRIQNSFFLSPTDFFEIMNVLKRFSPRKSTGPDNIPTKILKLGARSLSPILSCLINECFSSGFFPKCLKLARVTPIFKGGDPSSPSEWRPISIVPVLSKLIEKLVCTRLNKYLIKNKILTNYQFGFRSGHSTAHAILNINEQILANIDCHQHTLSIFLDLSKAFNCVNHDILLGKLQKYGITGIALDFFRSYLTDQYQFTRINGCDSLWQKITCGVPQGSVLGPLLFIIYMNDLSNVSRFSVSLFADDTCLVLSHKDLKYLEVFCNRELEIIEDWFKANKLTANLKKASKYMLTSGKTRKNSNLPGICLKMGTTTLERVETMKYLGVTLDEKFSWTAHVMQLKLKLASSVGILAKLKYYLNTKILIQVYHALIGSRLHYSISCWGAAAQTVLAPIKVLQNRAVRFISKTSRYTRLDITYLNLRLLKFNDIYNLSLAQFMYNYNLGTLPPFFLNYIQSVSSSHNYPTHFATANSFRPLRCKKAITQRSIRFKGPSHWNPLPPQVKNASKSKFKREYKNHIFPLTDF